MDLQCLPKPDNCHIIQFIRVADVTPPLNLNEKCGLRVAAALACVCVWTIVDMCAGRFSSHPLNSWVQSCTWQILTTP